MRVRRAVASDSAAAAAIVRAVYEEFGFTWDEDGYHADLRDVEASYAAFFVAERDGRIVGTAGLTSHGSLERLYVLSEARGSGAGSALLTAVAAEARRRGHVQLEIWSDKRFTDAHRLYERHGARVVGERQHDDPDASHEWGLVLQLTDPPPRRDVTAAHPSGDCPRTGLGGACPRVKVVCRCFHTGAVRLFRL